MVWMILLELIDLDSLVEHGSPFAFKAEGGAMPALATRHWYKTACEAQSARDGEAPDATYAELRLPELFFRHGRLVRRKWLGKPIAPPWHKSSRHFE